MRAETVNAVVDALVAAGTAGIVVACTGNGTVHHALQAGLRRAQAHGVSLLRASRCAAGPVTDAPGETPWAPSAGPLSPVQACVELLLDLLARSTPPGLRRARAVIGSGTDQPNT
jgi:L-asparaginase